MNSPFLELPESAWIAQNELAFAILDAYPVTPGHALIVPRNHRRDWQDATPDERIALTSAVDDVRAAIRERHGDFEDFNVGINSGPAAGQTVFHLHMHVIPRRPGDVSDPRGGVRNIVPDKAAYWEDE